MINVIIFIEILNIILFYNATGNRSIFTKLFLNIFSSILLTGVFLFITRNLQIGSFIAITIIGIILSVLISLIYKCDIIEGIIGVLIGAVLIFIEESIMSVVLFYVLKWEKVDVKITLITLIPVSILFIYAIKKVCKEKNLNFNEIIMKNRQYSLVLINSYIFMLLVKVIIDFDLLDFKLLINFLFILIILVSSNILYFIYDSKREKENKRYEIKDNINPLIDELLEKLRASEHEYKNHLNILYCMMQIGDEQEIRDRAKKYIGNVMEEEKFLSDISEIENTIVRAMIFSKVQEAEKNNVYCDFEIESKLDKIKLDDSELTVVLSNLLNNAIEAAKDSLEKEVLIYIGENKNKSIIRVSNSALDLQAIDTSKIFVRGYSTKGENRGYGMYNIKEIISKNKGNINIYKDENMINIEVVI